MSASGAGIGPRGRAARPEPVRVVVVADAGSHRSELIRALEADGDIAVVGVASDPLDAVAQVTRIHPHVVAVDLVEEGQRVVEQIMKLAPTPILVFSGDGSAEATAARHDVIRAGALDTVVRPAHWTPSVEVPLRRQVRLLRGVTVVRHPRAKVTASTFREANAPADLTGRPNPVVAIAASTGGPAALATVLAGLAGVGAPILVVQHIHPDFVDGLVAWMDRVAPIPVQLAVAGEVVRPGIAYISPGNVHLKLGPGMRIVLDPDGPSRHRPSADQLFLSVARHAGLGAIGVVLTGMGDDGAEGLQVLRDHGGLTIAQDEASSAVFGMPRAALLRGAVSEMLPLQEIAPAVVAAARSRD